VVSRLAEVGGASQGKSPNYGAAADAALYAWRSSLPSADPPPMKPNAHASWTIASSILLSLAACKATPETTAMSAADREELGRLLSAAKVKAEDYSRAREIGLRDAYRSIPPSPDSAPCTVKIPLPPPLTAETLRRDNDDPVIPDTVRWRLNVVPGWAIIGVPPPEPLEPIPKLAAEKAARGPRRDQFDRQSSMLARLVQEGRYTTLWPREALLKLANELGSDEYWGWELDVVAAVRNDAVHDTKLVLGGRILGRAFVWSFREGKVLCASNVVDGKNQQRIVLFIDPKDDRVRTNKRLDDDLENETLRAAIPALRTVGDHDAAPP
jgi:hypothetical protein